MYISALADRGASNVENDTARVDEGLEGCFRCGWTVSLAGRRRIQYTSEGARRGRTPQMDISNKHLAGQEQNASLRSKIVYYLIR